MMRHGFWYEAPKVSPLLLALAANQLQFQKKKLKQSKSLWIKHNQLSKPIFLLEKLLRSLMVHLPTFLAQLIQLMTHEAKFMSWSVFLEEKHQLSSIFFK